MRGIRRAVSFVAIVAIALHSILLSLAPPAAASATDPFSVICHSVAQAGAPGDETPGSPDLAPGHACEHCNLCSAAAMPPAPDVALNVSLGPAPVLRLLRPVSARARADIASNPGLARGPPHFA